jgi:hypothetical protein
MTETRLKELQTEIARLEELDTKTTNRVNNEFEDNTPEHEPDYIDFINRFSIIDLGT